MKVYNPTHRTRGGSALKAPLDVSFNIAVKTISRLYVLRMSLTEPMILACATHWRNVRRILTRTISIC